MAGMSVFDDGVAHCNYCKNYIKTFVMFCFSMPIIL